MLKLVIPYRCANKGCYINPAYVDKDGLAAVVAASNGDLRVAQ
ncbi:hypothetical protein [Escherichia coli]|nr:hypothetical protein [Escherichia coli]